MLDIVDERDQVMGRESRREIHRLALRHRAVHVLVFNQRGELFLQKRSLLVATFPGAWDSSASGHVSCGEDYDLCAVRELHEELGWTSPHPLQRLFKLNACAENGHEFMWVYQCHGEGPFTLHPEEIERGGWFTPQAITRWLREDPEDFASGFRVLWSKWLDLAQAKS